MGKPVDHGAQDVPVAEQAARRPRQHRRHARRGLHRPDGVRVVLDIPMRSRWRAACAHERGVDEIAVIGGADIFRGRAARRRAHLQDARCTARRPATPFSRQSTGRIGTRPRASRLPAAARRRLHQRTRFGARAWTALKVNPSRECANCDPPALEPGPADTKCVRRHLRCRDSLSYKRAPRNRSRRAVTISSSVRACPPA